MALSERTDARLALVDRVVHRSGSVAVGAFRCPPGHALFHDSGPIENDVFVFPRTRVWIAHAGGRRFLADPAVVTLYNRGQLYGRWALDETGDRCDYFAVDRELALELARAHDPEVGDRPFRFDHAAIPAATYLRQRVLFERLARGDAADALEVEETVLELLASVLDAAYAVRGRATRHRDNGDEHEVVRRARLALASRFADPMPLSALAREVGVSRSRLCRAFKRVTGTTLHACREQMRLHAALEALAPPAADLTALALDFGYSSHSHFSANFKRAFGLPPSHARRRLNAGAGPQ